MRGIKSIISILLTVSVLFSCLFCIYPSADESTTEHTSCVKEHFGIIQDNNLFPANRVGSCSYTTLSIILSFYDSYWNDGFVPEQYEGEPGRINSSRGDLLNTFQLKLENDAWNTFVSNNDVDTSNSEEKETAYAQFIQDNADEYFQLYLISLAIEEGYHDGELVYGLQPDEVVSFLEFYLYDICGFNSNQITVNLKRINLNTTKEDMFNTAKSHIQNGFPIMYGGTKIDLDGLDWFSEIGERVGGHALLGYDLTSDENDVIMSKCWNNHSTTTFYTNEYENFPAIIWLEINEEEFPHVCSYNYVNTYTGDSLCACEIYSEHPNHEHAISSGGEMCPAAINEGVCICGQAVLGTHSYDTTGYSSTQHWLECDCGDTTNVENHTFTYHSNGEQKHTRTCACGYTDEVFHTYTYQRISSTKHSCTCECGYTKNQTHTIVQDTVRYSHCVECGAVFDAWSDITIKGQEEEEDSK